MAYRTPEEGQKLKKKISIILSIVLVIALAAAGFFVIKKYAKKEMLVEEVKQSEIQKQIQELDNLREEAGGKNLTKEETEQQTQNLDELQKVFQQKQQSQPLTQENIQNQLDELDRLRNQ